jgi:hypothetical protein
VPAPAPSTFAARFAAQYAFIRSPCAFRASADIPPWRFRLETAFCEPVFSARRFAQ